MAALLQSGQRHQCNETEAERAQIFQFKPLWQRALIVLAGPLTNLLFAVAIFAAFNLAYGRIVASSEIATLAEGSAAAQAGLKVGDRILAIDGERVENFPGNASRLMRAKPIYEELEGWGSWSEETAKLCRQGVEVLPRAMRDYVAFIEKSVGVKADIISLGKRREETIDLRPDRWSA